MCGYVSKSTLAGVRSARTARNVADRHEAGNFYGVASVSKKGKVSPFASHTNTDLADARRRAKLVQGYNPTSTIVVVDLRYNTIVEAE